MCVMVRPRRFDWLILKRIKLFSITNPVVHQDLLTVPDSGHGFKSWAELELAS